ncbi:MAG: phage tail tape measure protein [Lachnospiraceae bacterium]|nr:phage tail tape measure protein [Lachnospiraceae bacterium]MBP3905960.1 phage tail tape measure protein [Peptostreptococcaceae bacterium]
MAKINFTLDFNLNKDGIKQAGKELDALMRKLKDSPEFGLDKELQKAYKSAEALKKALSKSFDKNFEKLGVREFNNELSKSGQSLNSVEKNLTAVGVKGAKAFNEIEYEINKVGLSVKQSNKFLNEMFDTFSNTVKWGIASSAMNQMTGAVQRAVGFTKSLDESLNNIQVVSGKNTAEMESFAKEANEAAKALGKTTTEYTDASLIFFQQGKTASEVKELTEATLLGANITGESVSDMADYLTAVMNGYVMEANRALEVTDKLAAVGAATGSDFQELAIGMSKVASMAKVVGVDIDQLNGMLATVTTVTREAPETIGTTFKTIFARMSELQAGGEDEEGWTTGKVEAALNKVGMSVLDEETGQLRDMGKVIEQIGEMWTDMNRESQVAVANALAGQRQASRLIALFENWSMYTDAVNTSQNALGSTMEQNAVRMDSLAYQSKQLEANLESMWMRILNEDTLAAGTTALNKLIDMVNDFIDSLGGIGNTLGVIGALAAGVFSKQIAGSLQNTKDKLTDFAREAKNDLSSMISTIKNVTPTGRLEGQNVSSNSESEEYRLAQQERISELQAGELKIKRNLSTEEHQRYKELTGIIAKESEALTLAMRNKEIAEDIAATGGLATTNVKAELSVLKSKEKALENIKNSVEAAKDSTKATTVEESVLLEKLGKQDQYTKNIVEQLKVSNKGRIQIKDIEELITKELEAQEDAQTAINELQKAGLNNAEAQLEAQEAKTAEITRQAEGEITELEKKAAREQLWSTVISGAAAAGTAIFGVVGALKEYNKEGATFEDQTNAITTGFSTMGASLMMMPGIWFKVAGAVSMATGWIIKFVRENTGMGEILKTNEAVLERYQNRMADIADAQERLNQVSDKFEEIDAITADGLLPEERESLQQIRNEIAELKPEMVDYYDAYGNAVLKNRDALKEMNDELERQREIERNAMKENSGNFGQEYGYRMAGIQEEIASKETELAAEQQYLNELLKGGPEAEAALRGSDKSMWKSRQEEIAAAIDSTEKKIASLTTNLTDLRESSNSVGKDIQSNMIDVIVQSEGPIKNLGKSMQGLGANLLTQTRVMDSIKDAYQKAQDQLLSAEDSSALQKQVMNDIQARVEGIAQYFVDLKNADHEWVETLSKSNAQTQQYLSETMYNLGATKEEMDSLTSAFVSMVDGDNGFFDIAKLQDESNAMSQVFSSMMTTRMNTLEEYKSQLDAMKQEVFSTEDIDILAREWVASMKNAIHNAQRDGDSAGAQGLQTMLDEFNRLGSTGNDTDMMARNEILFSDTELLERNKTLLDGQIDQYLELSNSVATYQEQIANLSEAQAELTDMSYNYLATIAETDEGYSYMAETFNSFAEALGEFGGDMDGIFEGFDAELDGMVEKMGLAADEAKNIEQDLASNIGKAFQALPDKMGDSYKDLLKLTGKTSDEMTKLAQEAAGGGKDAAKELSNSVGKIYAAMNMENADYYKEFVKYNQARLQDVAATTGIMATDYDNLAQFQNDLERWKAEVADGYHGDQYNSYLDMVRSKLKTASDAGADEQKIAAATTAAANVESANQASIVANNMYQMVAKAADAISNIPLLGKLVSRGVQAIVNKFKSYAEQKSNELKSAQSILDAALGDLNLDDITLDNYLDDTTGVNNFVMPAGPQISTGRPTSGTTGPSVSNSGGGDKGDSSKGSEEKEVEDLEWEKDIYHDINVELQQKQSLLDKLKKQQDKLYGKELLDNLAKQKKALEEQQKLLETKLKMQQQDLANQKAVLSQQGVAFNVDGTIANYNQLLEQKVAYVNSLSGEAKEAAKEEFAKLTEMMEAYEDMMLNSIIETENAIQDSIDAQREIFLTEFTYAIDLKIEISDDFKEALDFVKEMNNEYEDMSDNYERTIAQMGEQVDLVERLKIKLDAINNNPNLSEKERLELLEKYNAELKDAIKDLNKLNDELTTIFEKTLKDGLDINKKHLENFKSLNSELKHYEQTLKLIGEGDNFQVLDSIYEAQYNNLMSQINVLNGQMDVLQAQRDALKAEGMEGTKEWEAIDKAIKDTQKDINSLAQESLKLLQTEFKNSVNEMLSTLEDAMTGGAGFKELKKQQQEIKDERKKYLDGEEKLLAVSKLQQKVQKEIDETTDPAKKKQLQKFMDSELKNLKEKDKLTKYDVDRANQVYDLTLKQMALEDQRATKNIMRLVRDSQGNWVYEFTEDANAIAKAQEEVSSSMEKLMELDKKKLEETQDLMLKLQEEYYKEVQQIANDAANGKYKTEEELRQALQAVTDKYNQKMIEANAEYEYVKQNATLSSMAVIVDSYAKTGDILENLTTEQEIILQALADKTGNSYLEMSNIVSNLISGDDDSIKSAMIELGLATEVEMDSVSNTISSTLENLGTNTTITLEEVKTAVGGLVANMQDGWGTSVSDMISKMISTGGFKDASTQAIQGVQDKWTEYQGKVQEVQEATGTDLNTMKTNIENVDKATEELNKETVALTNKFKEEMTAVTNLTNAYKGYRAEIQNTIKELTNYVAEINKVIDAIKRKNDTEAQANKKPSTSGGTSSGGSSSNGGGGGGNSTAKPAAPSLNVGSTVQVKSGTRWYYDSWGMNPSGKAYTTPLQITSISPYADSTHKYNLGTKAGEYLGWVKKTDIQGYDTGGYTGEWGKEGKMAFLHEKEIVLNKEDTSKILDAVKLVRGISGDALSGLAGMIAETSRRTIEALGAITQAVMPSKIQTQDQGQQIQQNVEINADFSGVKSSNEIEKAFENMANMASQYIARK